MASGGLDIASPACFNPHGDPTKLAELWKKWIAGFDIYLAAANITEAPRKRALLLHCGGLDLQELFDTLPGADNANTYDLVKTLFTTHFTPAKNKHYERHIFHSCVQTANETLSQYVTKLRTLAKTCEFHDANDDMVDQIIEKCWSNKLRKALLKEKELTLTKTLEIALVMESADRQIVEYENTSARHKQFLASDDEINKVTDKNRRSKKHSLNKSASRLQLNSKYDTSDSEPEDRVNRISKGNQRFKKSPIINTNANRGKSSSTYCYRCGNPSHFADKCTIAINNKCKSCGKKGHFSSVCINSKIQGTSNQHVSYVYASSSSDDDFVFALGESNNNTTEVSINNKLMNILIDSGSTVNVISKTLLKAISPNAVITPYTKNIYAFHSKEALPTLGATTLTIKHGKYSSIKANFVIVPDSSVAILGRTDATTLNLPRIGPTKSESISSIDSPDNTLDSLLKEYDQLFHGLGKLKDVEVKIHVNTDITPSAQNARRLPIIMQEQVDAEIDYLIKKGVIEPVTDPPTWVSPLVIVPKKDSSGVRICVDMRAANSAMIREPYQIPTLEEVAHKFKDCTTFTKLDLNKGYHQIALSPESRDLTCFAAKRGIFRYTRLLFGMGPAAEIYQREIERVLSGLQGTANISDDIIIGGIDKADLLNKMKAVFQRLKEKHLTVNLDKCEFLKKEIKYMGHIISANGISADKTRVDCIASLKCPSNVKELRSFLGMINYCAKFISHFANITDPLRKLLKKEATWSWDENCQSAFILLKDVLLSAETLAFYNQTFYTEVAVDASPVGLGAVISQKQPDGTMRPISYASRALSDVECRYSQIERECLAILFAVERFKFYLYGIPFTVITDHKPLVPMFKLRSHPPPRIERWIARLMPYNISIQYQPGCNNPADYFSRSNPSKILSTNKMGDNYIHMVTENALPRSISLKQLQKATLKDDHLQHLAKSIQTGKFQRTGALSKFYTIRNYLSESKGLILFKQKIVIPTALQFKIFRLAHEGHQGVVRTKQRLRRKVFWPGINEYVDSHIKSCHPCQLVGKAQPLTPITPTKIPDRAWLLLGCDLCGPFPSGEHLLVCVDYFSRYPEVSILHSVTSDEVSRKLRKLFCRYGPPEAMVTDNGPQFQKGTSFTQLLHEFSVDHRKVAPYHPMANGEVERFNRNLKKCIQTAIAEGIDWKAALQNFLLSYRTTPHAVTGVAPATLLFNRDIRDKLPGVRKNNTCTSKEIKAKDMKSKLKSKQYSDTKLKTKQHNITPGNLVILQNMSRHRNKFTPRWETVPGTVTKVKGNAIFVKRGNKNIMRSSNHVKRYFPPQNANQSIPHTHISSSSSEYVNSSESDPDDTIPYERDVDVNSSESDPDDTIPYERDVDVNTSESDTNDTIVHEDIERNESEMNNTFRAENQIEMGRRVSVKPRKLNDYVMQ